MVFQAAGIFSRIAFTGTKLIKIVVGGDVFVRCQLEVIVSSLATVPRMIGRQQRSGTEHCGGFEEIRGGGGIEFGRVISDG
ncbi:MAG: hypothetical protein IPL59_08395 [Candidatus Competibacteraceae bacterium]|nr:hypothetical protein [Candidatus Competibacteraceae bacterium]